MSEAVLTKEVNGIKVPIEYAKANLLEVMFGLDGHKLLELSRKGIIGSKKTGPSRGSNRLYNVSDIREWLEREGDFETEGEEV